AQEAAEHHRLDHCKSYHARPCIFPFFWTPLVRPVTLARKHIAATVRAGFRQQEVVMSRCYVPCSVLAIIMLNSSAARSGEPPGTAKPIPESERQSRLELPA